MKYRVFREFGIGWDPTLKYETDNLHDAIAIRDLYKKQDERHEYTIMQFVDVKEV